MKLIKVVSSAVLLLVFPHLGCSKVLGIEEKQLVTDGDVTDCPLVAPSGFGLRVMNAIPGTGPLDLCHKSKSGGGYGKKGWFAAQGERCGSGVAYTQFTRDLQIEPGTYDFKLVAAGSLCADAGIEINSLKIKADTSITLMAYGVDLSVGQISVLANRTEPTNSQPVRFIHALNNAGLLTAGLRSRTATDTVGTSLFVGVEYGKAASRTEGATGSSYDDVDSAGYVVLGGPETPQLELQFGVQIANESTVALAAPVPVTHGHAYTVFALGTNGVTQPRPKIWSCDENDSIGAFLTCGNPQKLSVEVFNPNIADAFTPGISLRVGPAIDAMLSASTDLLCATELYDPAVVEQLRNNDSSVFQYRVFSNDVTAERVTSFEKTVEGTIPEYPDIACPADLGDGLREWFECAESSPDCAMLDSGDVPEHVLTYPGERAMGCMFECGSTGAALGMIGEIQSGGRSEAGSCYWCAITHLASYESFESTLGKCTSPMTGEARRHMAFDGSAGLAVFSREAELGDPELVLLPSSGWQRAAMRVPVVLGNGATFDYWCTSVRFPNTDDALSYAGPYGTWGTTGSAEEQAFEVATVASVIDERVEKSGVPAIVGIVAHAGPEVVDEDSGQTIVYPMAPEIYDLMGQQWASLVAAKYVPECTFCGDSDSNPLNSYGETYRFWSTHLFGVGIDATSVESTKRTFMEATISVSDEDGTTKKLPVSQHFGLRSVVRITQ